MEINDERRVRIPYRLGTDQFCEYEEDDGEVCMGDMVTVCCDTYKGESECSGELCYVRYDWLGYIDAVIVRTGRDGTTAEIPCEGVFYRMEEAHATN